MDFNKLYINFKSVTDNFDDIVIQSISDNKEEIIDLNTGQLEKGIASDGVNIEPGYAFEGYASFKKSIGSNAPKGTPDLKLTGDFYSGFKIGKIQPNYFDISSDDKKTGELVSKYSDLIFGLTDENKNVLIEYLQQSLKDKLYEKLTR